MITGHITDNKFIPDNEELFRYEFQKRNGKQVCIEVKALGKKTKLYKFLFGVIYEAYKEYTGATVKAIDLGLKNRFFFAFADDPTTGDSIRYLKSKSEASYEELCRYVTDCFNYGQ